MSKHESGRYEMRIGLGALRHLGIGLYSNNPAVIAELVANAWDADAKQVDIGIDKAKGIVTVQDDGVGMDLDDVNDRFLFVGYDKRHDRKDDRIKRKQGETVSAKFERASMGRKGIGKLSVFSIAEEIKVYTKREGKEGEAFLLSRAEIQKTIESGSKDEVYQPKPLPTTDIDFEKGTRIVLSKLNNKLSWTAPYLKTRLARRFVIIGNMYDFKVRINEEEVKVEDRGFYNKLQFLWYFDEATGRSLGQYGNIVRSQYYQVEEPDITRIPTPRGKEITVPFSLKGWIGTTTTPFNIDETNGAVAVFSRGRIVSEDIARDIKESGIFRQYVVGEIYADFLDVDEAVDVATSNRQQLNEEDPRTKALKSFLKKFLDYIQLRWTGLRKELGVQQAFQESPAIRRWYDRLTRSHQDYARKLIGRIESLPIADQQVKKEFYRSSLIAFEKLAVANSLSKLEKIETSQDFALLNEIFSSFDEYEATQYYQIVDSRLKIIKTLKETVETEKARDVATRHLPDHLWLLDPSWERASLDTHIEAIAQQVYEELELEYQYESSPSEGIRYRYVSGRHILIDFRSYDERPTVGTLVDQIGNFKREFSKAIGKSGSVDQRRASIEYVCILGWPLEVKGIERALEGVDARTLTYAEVVNRAEDIYKAYLIRQRETAFLVNLIDTIAEELSREVTETEVLAVLPETFI